MHGAYASTQKKLFVWCSLKGNLKRNIHSFFKAFFKANRAAYVLRQSLSTNGSSNIIDVKLALSLFDKLVSPVLLYGCCVWGVSDPTNPNYLQNIDEGGNPRNIALKELSKCGNDIKIISARRVGRISDHNYKPRDILVDVGSYDQKLLLLYNNKNISLKENIRNYDINWKISLMKKSIPNF